MNNVDRAVEQLITAILDSDTYREYDIQRNKINQEPELKAQVDEFRRRNYELQNVDNPSFDRLDSFEKEFEEIRDNPLADDFLIAELAFCRMMQEINLRITAAMNFE